MADFTLLPGDPDLVSTTAGSYQQMAAKLLSAARSLREIADNREAISKSTDAAHDELAHLAAAIQHTEPRYRGTADALSEYSVHLRDAQHKAQSAIDASQHGRELLAPLERREYELRDDRTRALALGRTPDEIQQIDHDLRVVSHHIQDAQSEIASAGRDWDEAVADLDRAAEWAIARISPVLDELNDSVLDIIGQEFADLKSWAAQTMAPFFLGLKNALFDLVMLEVVKAALAVAVGFVIVVVGIGGVILPLFMTPDNLQLGLNALMSTLLAVVPVLVPSLKVLLAAEAMNPTPKMTELTAFGGELRDPRPAGRYEDAFNLGHKLDAAGGIDRTVVSVIQVMNPDGSPRLENGKPVWRVTLPSTMNWQFVDGDTGAANDLGSNLALILTPNQQAAYERAVISAMQQAGVGPQDPVMLVGFSQGGILAGKLATTQPFSIRAIVVAGAPIDNMAIPADVSVLSMQHPRDPVPQLEGASHADTPTWVTIRIPPNAGEPDHDAVSYAHTAAESFDAISGSSEVSSLVEAQSMFFSDTEIEHQFSGVENQ